MKKVNLTAMATILSAGILAAEGTPAALHDKDIQQSRALSQEFGEGRKAGHPLVALALPLAKSHSVDHQPTYCLPSCDTRTQKALAYWNKKQQEVKDLRAKATQLRTEAAEWNKKVNWKRLAMAKKLFFGSMIGGTLGSILGLFLVSFLSITSAAAGVVLLTGPLALGFIGAQTAKAIEKREGTKADEAWSRKVKAHNLEKKAFELQDELEGQI